MPCENWIRKVACLPLCSSVNLTTVDCPNFNNFVLIYFESLWIRSHLDVLLHCQDSRATEERPSWFELKQGFVANITDCHIFRTTFQTYNRYTSQIYWAMYFTSIFSWSRLNTFRSLLRHYLIMSQNILLVFKCYWAIPLLVCSKAWIVIYVHAWIIMNHCCCSAVVQSLQEAHQQSSDLSGGQNSPKVVTSTLPNQQTRTFVANSTKDSTRGAYIFLHMLPIVLWCVTCVKTSCTYVYVYTVYVHVNLFSAFLSITILRTYYAI